MKFFRNTVQVIRTINQRYAMPQMKMTRGARISLGVLRFYLLFLVGLLVYKFISLLH